MGKKVFLGGTCNDSLWRDEAIRLFDAAGVEYFNPVVDVWNDSARKREEKEKGESTFRLYCITPEMTGFYSIAEVVDDSNKYPDRTILVLLFRYGWHIFSGKQERSMTAVADLVERNGAKVFMSIRAAADWIADA